MNRITGIGLTAALAAGLLAGCSGSDGDEAVAGMKKLGKDEQATVKIMYYDEQSFYSKYGNLFLSKFPNIDLQVVSTSGLYKPNMDYDKAVESFIEEQQPDLIMLQENQYEKYAAEGKLLELDGVVKQEKFDTAGIHPGILELLRSKGGGKLYGLAPDFYSQAVFYNKTVFDQYGVPYPKDQMSWEDLLNLAKRFPTDGDKEKRIYGLYQAYDQGLFGLGSQIGHTNGLAFVDAGAMKMTIQSDSWKKVFQTAIDAAQSKAIYKPEPGQDGFRGGSMEEYLKSNLFIAGRAAMTIDGGYFLENLNRAKDALKDTPLPQWEVVTVPVDPAHPDTGLGLSLNQIFAVNAKSPNLRATWELLKYISGDEYAKIMSRSSLSGGMLARTGYIKDKNGHNLEAFYKLKPISGTLYQDYQKLPNSFFPMFQAMAEKELSEVLNQNKTLDAVLQILQTQGQATLNQTKEEQEKQAAAKP
ncbi:ABC transporter substrate-binding protein [Gorillibacterium sp. sgz5001074]|uniref:ABC transporter substrate-binding protein n=1 Tax=Gorillibacterium sp. sgz5001074 TaxID=3446695 RepID=UPI003F66327B